MVLVIVHLQLKDLKNKIEFRENYGNGNLNPLLKENK